MDWRTWAYESLLASPFADVVPEDRLYAGGSLTGAPDVKPWVELAFGILVPELTDGGEPIATSQTLVVWAYDDPGTYETIDNILGLARDALIGPVVKPGAHFCSWQGDSVELANDVYKAITRNATFRLTGGS